MLAIKHLIQREAFYLSSARIIVETEKEQFQPKLVSKISFIMKIETTKSFFIGALGVGAVPDRQWKNKDHLIIGAD